MESLAEYLQRNTLQRSSPQPTPKSGARRVTVQEWARGILSSEEYRQSIIDRIKIGSIPAQVETLWYYYAEGKPIERVQVRDVTDDIDEMDAAACEREALRLLELARELRASESSEDSSERSSSIH